MSKFVWDGQEWELVENPTFGELEHVERLLKRRFDEWSTIDNKRVLVWLTIRRADHTRLPWAAMTEMSPVDFDVQEEPTSADDEGENGTDPPGAG